MELRRWLYQHLVVILWLHIFLAMLGLQLKIEQVQVTCSLLDELLCHLYVHLLVPLSPSPDFGQLYPRSCQFLLQLSHSHLRKFQILFSFSLFIEKPFQVILDVEIDIVKTLLEVLFLLVEIPVVKIAELLLMLLLKLIDAVQKVFYLHALAEVGR